MWTLDTPWYELFFRGTIIYLFVFIVLRIWGKKHLGEMTAFDFIILIFISEAIQNSLVADDKSVLGGMIVVLTFIFWNVLTNKMTFHFRKMEKILDGEPRIIIKNGVVDFNFLKKEEISEQELTESLRLEGVLNYKDVKLATLESNGKISVIKKEGPGDKVQPKVTQTLKRLVHRHLKT